MAKKTTSWKSTTAAHKRKAFHARLCLKKKRATAHLKRLGLIPDDVMEEPNTLVDPSPAIGIADTVSAMETAPLKKLGLIPDDVMEVEQSNSPVTGMADTLSTTSGFGISTKENTETPRKCSHEHCSAEFTEIVEFLAHKNYQEKKEPIYTCPLENCTELINNNNKTNLHNHIREHCFESPSDGSDENQPLLNFPGVKFWDEFCAECKKGFQSTSDLKKHCMTHAEVIKCFICMVEFNRLEDLIKHKEERMQCPHCPVKLCLTKDFLKHCKTHAGFDCRPCNVSFKTFKQLQRHYKSEEGCDNRFIHKMKKLECKDCGSDRKCEHGIEAAKEHQEGPATFSCIMCAGDVLHQIGESQAAAAIPLQKKNINKPVMSNRSHTNNISLPSKRIEDNSAAGSQEAPAVNLQMRKEQIPRPGKSLQKLRYRCLQENCRATFAQKTEFLAHRKSHHIKNCPLDNCNQTMNADNKLRRHIKTHCRNPPSSYQCSNPNCPPAFPNACCICHAQFTGLADLLEHRNTHDNVEKCPYCQHYSARFDCGTCNLTNVTFERLQRHYQNHVRPQKPVILKDMVCRGCRLKKVGYTVVPGNRKYWKCHQCQPKSEADGKCCCVACTGNQLPQDGESPAVAAIALQEQSIDKPDMSQTERDTSAAGSLEVAAVNLQMKERERDISTVTLANSISLPTERLGDNSAAGSQEVAAVNLQPKEGDISAKTLTNNISHPTERIGDNSAAESQEFPAVKVRERDMSILTLTNNISLPSKRIEDNSQKAIAVNMKERYRLRKCTIPLLNIAKIVADKAVTAAERPEECIIPVSLPTNHVADSLAAGAQEVSAINLRNGLEKPLMSPAEAASSTPTLRHLRGEPIAGIKCESDVDIGEARIKVEVVDTQYLVSYCQEPIQGNNALNTVTGEGNQQCQHIEAPTIKKEGEK